MCLAIASSIVGLHSSRITKNRSNLIIVIVIIVIIIIKYNIDNNKNKVTL